jgi:hypothetical protein
MQDIVDQVAAGQQTPSNTVAPVTPGMDGQAPPTPQGPSGLPTTSSGPATVSTGFGDDIVSQVAASQPKAPDTNPQDQQWTGPNFANRAADTSGAHGMLSLAEDTIKNSTMRPMDLYKQAVDFANAGDWKNAAEVAFKLTMLSSPGVGILEKDNPLIKAATSIITHPIDEARAQAADDRKAGGEWNSLTNSANNLITGVTKDAKSGDYLGVAGDLAGMADSHIAGAIPLIGPALQQAGKYLDSDLHSHNLGAVAGDILGPLLTLGAGKLLGSASETAEEAATGINSTKAGSTEIAGEQVPRAQNHPGNMVTSPTGYQFPNNWVDYIRQFATSDGARDFVNEQVAPAASKANTSNLVDAAVNQVDALRTKRGEPLASEDPALTLDSLDDVQKFLKSELSRQVSDDALSAKRDATLQAAATGEGPAAVPKIKYTKMDNLIDQISFLNDKVKQAVKDSSTGVSDSYVDTGYLKVTPKLFDDKFGQGSFQKLLGKQGMDNYNKIVDAMRTPVTGGGKAVSPLPNIPPLMSWVSHTLPLGTKFRLAMKLMPKKQIADNLLFNPKAGTTALSLYNIAKQLGHALLTGSDVMNGVQVNSDSKLPGPVVGGPQAETTEAQPDQEEPQPQSHNNPPVTNNSAANVYQNLRGL